MEANIGYCCFVNKNWIGLAEILINRILSCSKYKIELFAINFDYSNSNDRVICNRIDVSPENFTNICYCKFTSALRSSFDFALIMDADMIPLSNVDELLEENYKLYSDCKYPVTAKLPNDIWKQENLQSQINILKRDCHFEVVMPYRYGSYFFNKNCKWFFEEALTLSKTPSPFFGVDETILNVLLNKYKFTEHLNYNYLPYYSGYESIVDGSYVNSEFYSKEYFSKGCSLRPYILHGCKNLEQAEKIVSFLDSMEGEK